MKILQLPRPAQRCPLERLLEVTPRKKSIRTIGHDAAGLDDVSELSAALLPEILTLVGFDSCPHNVEPHCEYGTLAIIPCKHERYTTAEPRGVVVGQPVCDHQGDHSSGVRSSSIMPSAGRDPARPDRMRDASQGARVPAPVSAEVPLRIDRERRSQKFDELMVPLVNCANRSVNKKPKRWWDCLKRGVRCRKGKSNRNP